MLLFPPSRWQFTSPKVSSEAQNELKTLEGLQKKKMLTPPMVSVTFSRYLSLVPCGFWNFKVFNEKSYSRQGIWSFRSEKVRFLRTFFVLRNGVSRHASNWAFVGAAIRGSVFFFDTSWEILTSQNRKGNSQCFLYAFSDWRHPKRESVNSGTTFRDRHAKMLLPPRNLLSTTFVNRSKNEKWLKHDVNFHLKIERKIGRGKPIDF